MWMDGSPNDCCLRAAHCAYMGTLGLIESTCFMSLESADSHNSDVLREKIESWEKS